MINTIFSTTNSFRLFRKKCARVKGVHYLADPSKRWIDNKDARLLPATISSNEKAAYLQQINLFITADMTEIERGLIVQNIAKLPSDQKLEILYLAKALITADMDAIGRSYFINQIAKLPSDQRADRVIRARDNLRQLPVQQRDLLMSRIDALLATPLEQPLPPLKLLHLAIDVHTGNRDNLTGSVMDCLISHHGEISTSETKRYIKELTAYLSKRTRLFSQNKFSLAKRVLTESQGCKRGKNWTWQALNGHEATVGGQAIDGSLFFAHVWVFCNNPSDQTEKENRLSALVHALVDSVENNQRVCPPGQMQRVVTAVLQGRLDGVNVDALTVSPAQALQHFFHDSKHQKVEEVSEMNEAVFKFLQENPLVDKKAFIHEINEYWKGGNDGELSLI